MGKLLAWIGAVGAIIIMALVVMVGTRQQEEGEALKELNAQEDFVQINLERARIGKLWHEWEVELSHLADSAATVRDSLQAEAVARAVMRQMEPRWQQLQRNMEWGVGTPGNAAILEPGF